MAAYTTIDNPELYFQTVLYTGNDSNRTITLPGDEDMAPDLVWVKNRANADWHRVANSLVGSGKQLGINNNAEDTNADGFTGFVSTGFTLGVDGSNIGVNETGEAHVAWCWKANGTGSANSVGSITTTATSANTTAGFSIVNYTGTGSGGATIGHGLGLVPDFILTKNRVGTGGAGDWHTFHGANTSAPETDYLIFSGTNATTDHNQRWNDTMPTTTLVTFGNDTGPNQSGSSTMAFIWSGIQGFSKFGSYTGNGNIDSPFIYLGFRPALVIIKKSSGAGDGWMMFDNKREGFNAGDGAAIGNNWLAANATTVESSNNLVDLLSNGFKVRSTHGGLNDSTSSKHLFMAWAEAPFVNSNGVPCNAR